MFNNPYGFAVDPVNDFFYVADYSNYRVQKFRLSTGQFIGSIGNSTLSGTCLLGKQSAWCTGGVFSSASGDGLFSNLKGIALDVDSNRLYVTNGINIQKFNLATGDFIEAIGKSTLSGSCVSGAQPSWCTGGNFSMGTSDGAFGFNNSIALDTENNKFYVTSNSDYRVQSFELSSGKFLGSIGYTTAASGTCALGIQNTWCTGGTFINGSNDGMFRSITHIAYADTKLYVFEYGRVQRITLP
jgi:DNA-binding beta-propeller fold protein YncE